MYRSDYMCNVDNKEEHNMAVLTVPISRTFEVAPEKAAEFIERSQKEAGKSKEALLKRLAEHDKGNLTWELNK